MKAVNKPACYDDFDIFPEIVETQYPHGYIQEMVGVVWKGSF